MNKFKKKNDTEKVDETINYHNEIDIKNKNNLKKKISDSDKVINNKEIIFDIPVNITIELGRSKIKIKELLNLSKGSVFFLNQHKEDPLKILANGKLVAFGEIVVSEKTYGVKIISIKNL